MLSIIKSLLFWTVKVSACMDGLLAGKLRIFVMYTKHDRGRQRRGDKEGCSPCEIICSCDGGPSLNTIIQDTLIEQS